MVAGTVDVDTDISISNGIQDCNQKLNGSSSFITDEICW